jgi:hypothetical protein
MARKALKIENTAYLHFILQLKRAGSFPACVLACVPVSTKLEYYYHCGVRKNIGLVIWTYFLPGVKVWNNHSLSCWLLIVKPIALQIATIQIDERYML